MSIPELFMDYVSTLLLVTVVVVETCFKDFGSGVEIGLELVELLGFFE
mgnify:CR=1 FL=1